jgi:hypothetical protein
MDFFVEVTYHFSRFYIKIDSGRMEMISRNLLLSKQTSTVVQHTRRELKLELIVGVKDGPRERLACMHRELYLRLLEGSDNELIKNELNLR